MNLLSQDSLLIVACVLCGIIAHVTKKTVQYRVTNKDASIFTYIKTYPYHVIYNVCISFGCLTMLDYADQLNYATSFLSGFMSNSLLSILRANSNIPGVKDDSLDFPKE